MIGRGIADAWLEGIEVNADFLKARDSLSRDRCDDSGGREGGEGGCEMHLCELCVSTEETMTRLRRLKNRDRCGE